MIPEVGPDIVIAVTLLIVYEVIVRDNVISSIPDMDAAIFIARN